MASVEQTHFITKTTHLSRHPTATLPKWTVLYMMAFSAIAFMHLTYFRGICYRNERCCIVGLSTENDRWRSICFIRCIHCYFPIYSHLNNLLVYAFMRWNNLFQSLRKQHLPINPNWQKSSTNQPVLSIVFSYANRFMIDTNPRFARMSSSSCT